MFVQAFALLGLNFDGLRDIEKKNFKNDFWETLFMKW